MLCTAQFTYAQTSGDMAFVYFNKEDDGFGLVTWIDLPANQTLYIRDDKRAGGTFTKTTAFTWNTGPNVIPAGTIITFTIAPSVSIGTVTMTPGLGIGNEPLWCFTGTDVNTPTTFITAIGNGIDDTEAFGTDQLTGTGLVTGTTAFRLRKGIDRAAYTGARGGSPLASYKTMVYDAANWTQREDKDPVLEFSATPAFSTNIVTVPAKIAFATEYAIAKEDAGKLIVSVTVKGANNQASSASVSLISNFGTAANGTDITYSAPVTVTFNANSPDNTTQTIEIPITNRSGAQNDRFFALQLSNFTNAEAGGVSKYVAYIQDVNNKGPEATGALELVYAGRFNITGGGTAEIVAYDSASHKLFVLNSTQSKIEVLDFSNARNMKHLTTLDMTAYGDGATSVAVKNGIVAATVSNGAEANGDIVFFNTAGEFLKALEVGNLPDMVTFTPDGKYVLTANEGQPNDDYSVDPEGSISMIDITGGIANLDASRVTTLTFHTFDAQLTELRTQGVRIYGPNATVSQDLEPEYITVSKDSKKAWVTLQENNALGEIDLVNKTITRIMPLGLKDYSQGKNTFDASDKTTGTAFANFPVKGMYEPDGIANYIVDGVPYLITANEGDDRAYGNFEEKVRVKSNSYILDETKFPHADLLKKDYVLGRLNVTNATGDINGDGKIDEIHALGGRSFSVWNGSTGALAFDSGDDFERITANHPVFGATFNTNAEADDDGVHENIYKDRSDDKGPEPEGITTAAINGKQYAFISLERMSGVLTYDVTNPSQPEYVHYVNSRSTAVGKATGDLGPEGLIYIAPQASPTDTAMVVVANEHSATVSVYSIRNVVFVSAPVARAATAITTTGFTANWDTAAGATGYELDLSADNFKTFVSGYEKKAVTGTSHAVSNLSQNVTYQYRVRALRGQNRSENSNLISTSTLVTGLESASVTPFEVYPNPAYTNQVTFSRKLSFTLRDAKGTAVLSGKNADVLDLTGIPNGLYFITTPEGKTKKLLINR